MPFVVVSRAACFAVSLRLAAFGGAGWPAQRVFVRWVACGGMRAVAFIAALFIAARAASRDMAHVGRRVVRRAQATTAVALPGFPSGAMVLFSGGARFGRLTVHPSGRLRRRLIQALGGKSIILLVVVSRAACFAVSLRSAVFGGAGWPARWVSGAGWLAAGCARWCVSLRCLSRRARLPAIWCGRQAGCSSRAGQNGCGIVWLSKRRYGAVRRRRKVWPSNSSVGDFPVNPGA